jgi:hypothetical protein
MSRYNLFITINEKDLENLHKNTNSFKNLKEIRGTFNIVYGYDHACGYFLQFYPNDEIAEFWLISQHIEECYDLDSIFGGLSGVEIAYFLKMFGGNKRHIDLANMDEGF